MKLSFRSRSFVAATATLALILAVAVFVSVRRDSEFRRGQEFIASVRTVRDQSGSQEALDLLATRRSAALPPAIQEESKALLEQLVSESRDFAKLNALIAQDPGCLDRNEKLALLKAQEEAASGNLTGLQQRIADWSSRPERSADWVHLEVVEKVAKNRPQEARWLLEHAGKSDLANHSVLLQRAVFAASYDEEEAWRLLLEAYEETPNDWQVRMFLGNFLEKRGQLQPAQREYVAACLLAPDNVIVRDRLGEFYLRYGRIGSALQTWTEAPGKRLPAFLWAKAKFWSLVYGATAMPALEETGISTPMAQALGNIPDGAFWSPEAEQAIAALPRIPEHQVYVFWLRVLNQLKRGDTEAARVALSQAPEVVKEGDEQLVTALSFLLDPSATAPVVIENANPAASHSFFQKLNDWEASKTEAGFADFCRSHAALSAAFLAKGWIRAAAELEDRAQADALDPVWFRYGMAKCLAHARGTEAASRWLDPVVGNDPELVLLRAEFDFVTGRKAKGLDRVRTIRRDLSAAGERASFLLILDHLERGELDAAEQLRREQPGFATSQTGAELGGRIALLRGDQGEAEKFFTPWKEVSAEAKLFFAKRAFDAGDFTTARTITEDLVKEMPLNEQWKRNLQAIQKAELAAAAATPGKEGRPL
jgi:hypothetical protein